MDEYVTHDLKQFIAASISQQTADLRSDITKLDQKIDDLSAAVAEALDVSNEETGKQLKDHEGRIGRLERKLA